MPCYRYIQIIMTVMQVLNRQIGFTGLRIEGVMEKAVALHGEERARRPLVKVQPRNPTILDART